MDNLTTELIKGLHLLGSNATNVTEGIDWLRERHNILVYERIEPFVDPISHKISYRYAVKKCNLRDGWNGRVHIGETGLCTNPYEGKREALQMAIDYLNKHNATLLKPGDITVIYSELVKVEKGSCSECEIHDICNRENIITNIVKDLTHNQFVAINRIACKKLIGLNHCFKKV